MPAPAATRPFEGEAGVADQIPVARASSCIVAPRPCGVCSVLRQLAVAASDSSVGMVLLVVSRRVFATGAWGGACAVVLSARTLLVLGRSVWSAAWIA